MRQSVGAAVVGLIVALVPVATLGPIGAAARSSCNLNSGACVGYGWGGVTSQPGVAASTDNITLGAISFVTDLSKGWIGHLQWDVIGEHCAAFPTGSIPIAGTDSQHQYRIVAGRISITENYAYRRATQARLPGIVSHLTGTLAGDHASGTARWSLAGPYRNACKPTSGSFTWHASLRAKIGNA